MNNAITTILTDATARESVIIEQALLQQTVATPWAND